MIMDQLLGLEDGFGQIQDITATMLTRNWRKYGMKTGDVLVPSGYYVLAVLKFPEKPLPWSSHPR